MTDECLECGKDLEVEPVERTSVDWVKVVCSDCGSVNDVSMIRLSEATHRKE